MSDEMKRFIERFTDPRSTLLDYLQELADTLESSDKQTALDAAKEVSEVLEWFNTPIDDEALRHELKERRRAAETALIGMGYSLEEVNKLLRSEADVKARGRGRPRTRGADAILALHLRRQGHSWRDILLETEGSCKDRGCPSYCRHCRDVRRSSTPAANPKRRLKEHCGHCKFLIRSADKREAVCYKCADRVADLASRLERFMRSRGLLSQPLPATSRQKST